MIWWDLKKETLRATKMDRNCDIGWVKMKASAKDKKKGCLLDVKKRRRRLEM